MKRRLFYLFKYYMFWIAVFIAQKILFLTYNLNEASELSLKDVLLILLHGLKLDLSMAAYLTLIPSLAVIFGIYLNRKYIYYAVNIYTGIFLFIILLLGIVDMELYSYWGFKLDITPLIYMKTPGEAIASVHFSEILLLIVIFFIAFYFLFKIYRKAFPILKIQINSNFLLSVPVGAIIISTLLIIARGGIGIAAINLSSVYFHGERFPNHSAINVTWNVLYSYIEREKLQTSFSFMSDDEAKKLVNENFNSYSGENKILIKPKSNVLLILLESFSNKLIEPLGGESSVTPHLNSLCRNGIVFDHFFASGDRSDKGLVSIFSGYPAQPTTSIIDYPAKSQELPFLYEPFSINGYETAFYYGGDLNFANFKSYFSNPFVDKLVTKSDFAVREQTQKWGVPDEILLKKLKTDLDALNKPFFYTCFTLSSHEPFDVPMKPVFGTDTRDDLSKNGFYYTDSVLHIFLQEGAKSSWWENTLVIITADHGSRSPGNTQNHCREKFLIPMIWTGGAILSGDSIIHTTGSQTDIPAILLSLFGYDHSNFTFSRNILDKKASNFAFYAFNNGFGCITPTGYVIYDNDFNACIFEEGQDPKTILETGKAFLQILSTDFLLR